MQHIAENEDLLISVVMATYNNEAYVCQAISSVLDQTYKNIELIVIDDGSTDNTEYLIKSTFSDRRLKYIKTENRGQTKAKNKGLKLANGNLIGFCDSDDMWEPEKLEIQLPKFIDEKVGVVYTEVSYIDEDGRPFEKPAPYVRYSGFVTSQLLKANFVPFGTAVIRRECLKTSGYFNENYKMGIDWDLWLRYSLDWKFSYCREKTYVYREWSGQMSKNLYGRYFYAFKILRSFEKAYPLRLDQEELNSAWSDMYISRGRSMSFMYGTKIDPLRDIVKGIQLNPLSIFGWKSLARIGFSFGNEFRYLSLRKIHKKLSFKGKKLFKTIIVGCCFSSIVNKLDISKPAILMYHRVNDRPETGSTSIREFRRQLQYISQYKKVVSLKNYIDMLKSGTLAKNVVALTFDDGYEDFYTDVWPLLKEFNIPASLFITTDFINGEMWMWPDKVRYLLLSENVEDVTPLEMEIGASKSDNFDSRWNNVCDFLLYKNEETRSKFIEQLSIQLDTEIPNKPTKCFRALNWQQLNEMLGGGLLVGSHTVSHEILSMLSDDEIKREILDSKIKIEKETSYPVTIFCYPNGMSKDILHGRKREFIEENYDIALTAYSSNSDEVDYYELGRVNANDHYASFVFSLL